MGKDFLGYKKIYNNKRKNDLMYLIKIKFSVYQNALLVKMDRQGTHWENYTSLTKDSKMMNEKLLQIHNKKAIFLNGQWT